MQELVQYTAQTEKLTSGAARIASLQSLILPEVGYVRANYGSLPRPPLSPARLIINSTACTAVLDGQSSWYRI